MLSGVQCFLDGSSIISKTNIKKITMNDHHLEPKSLKVKNDSTAEISALQKLNLYENDTPSDEMGEADDGFAYEIVMVDRNTYVSNIHIPANFFEKIIGERGETMCRIARDTKTNIKIPIYGESNQVSICGPSISNVKGAIRRINIIVMRARMKQRPTHFISVPMNGPHIVASFEKFKEQVLRECNVIEESLFNNPSKLHITLGVMSLMDNEEQLTASKLLTEAKEKYIMPLIKDHLPFRIKLKGLSFMNDDPKEINVLYGCVEEVDAPVGLLQRMVDDVVEHVNKSGLMNKSYETENVKMHVTLLSSKYRARQEQTEGTPIKYKTFDGSEVLSKFSDYDFGIMELTNIHLSQCNTRGPDGYYQSTCVISCNNNKGE